MGADGSVRNLWFSPHITIASGAEADPQTDPNHHKEGKWSLVRHDGPVHSSHPPPLKEKPSAGS